MILLYHLILCFSNIIFSTNSYNNMKVLHIIIIIGYYLYIFFMIHKKNYLEISSFDLLLFVDLFLDDLYTL